MARLTIRIDFDSKASFGPGKARLLEAIEATGSLRKAAATLKMSYRRAWLLLQDIEQAVRGDVTLAATGGKDGGGTQLTPLGRALVAHYRAIEREAEKAAATEMKALGGLLRTKRPARVPRGVTPKAPRKARNG
ncbi:MAG: LysR family transcriptional regulator [Alphaproteobacteria bacterium]|nr:LysR family transcriptional regulator [Alphaproteobacteria bacterium]